MRCRQIPGTDLEPSVICLGTVAFGSMIEQNEAERMLDAFIDMGGSFIDTAHIYADWACDVTSSSERCLGKWLKTSGKRDKICIATKGGHPELSSGRKRLTKDEIFNDLAESLEYLAVEYIDLYWLHRDDPSRPVDELLEILETAREKGYVRYYGCSNWTTPRLEAALRFALANGIPGFVANQPWWSLAVPNPDSVADKTLVVMDEEMIAYHNSTNMAVAAYSSQANGFFSGRYSRDGVKPDSPMTDHVVRTYFSEENFKRLERAVCIADRMNRSPNDVALAFLMNQSFPVFPIVGCRNMDQLRSSCEAADLILEKEQIDYLISGRTY